MKRTASSQMLALTGWLDLVAYIIAIDTGTVCVAIAGNDRLLLTLLCQHICGIRQ